MLFRSLVAGFFVVTSLIPGGCHQPASSTAFPLVAAQPRTNRTPTLTRSQVLTKFRERASPAEVQDFDRLAEATDADSQDRAREMVLFKLTVDELLQIGIAQTEAHGRYFWSSAVQYTPSADTSRAFEQALQRVGVKPGGMIDLGIVGWSVPREQFFIARRALLGSGLGTNEIRIIEPEFHLR